MTVQAMLAVLLSPSKMRYDSGRSLTKTRKIKAVLTGGFSIFLACLLFAGVQVLAFVWTAQTKVYAIEQTFVVQSSVSQEPTSQELINTVALQAAVDTWAKKYPGRASVYITDTKSGRVVASSNPDKQYFTASIYKLYVAYLGLQDIDSGVTDDGPFLNGSTRLECLSKMIQLSDSPCAEKMLNEIGKKNVDARLVNLGLTGTSLARFMTTAHDAGIITQKISNGEGLSKSSAALLQEAMNNQVYRTGLPAGFKNSVVADKVGFYETGYHDTANVTPKSGRVFTVSVLTENMGSRQIAELAKLLEPLL